MGTKPMRYRRFERYRDCPSRISWALGACIWMAHIGFDRMLGYGLKAATAFGDTHLGRVGGRHVGPAAATNS